MARYFVHLPADGSPAIFWRRLQGFPGGPIHINLNLLAHAVGDEPTASDLPTGAMLVPAQKYEKTNRDTVIAALRPFAFKPLGGNPDRPESLPIGPKLAEFLDKPLGGERMNLSLPFYDEDIKLGPTGGGWFRDNNGDDSFHGATDFNTRPNAVFNVCAAADGTVLAMAGDCLVLSHTTPNGRQFRTIYLHMDLRSVSHAVGAPVRRGEGLGSTDPTQPILHLHFGVAVLVPEFELDGTRIPAFWHFIDPWGVYDFRDGNYLPETGRIFDATIVGATHNIQWRTQPLFKTIPIARNTGSYRSIVRVQARVRRGSSLEGTLPPEHNQFLVWLEDDSDFFSVPLAQAGDSAMEFELVTLLRQAFLDRKQVRLEYRYDGELRFIMAAWVKA